MRRAFAAAAMMPVLCGLGSVLLLAAMLNSAGRER